VRDRFGATLTINLHKSYATKGDGFVVDPEKVAFKSNSPTDDFWLKVKGRFDTYVDGLMRRREQSHPERLQYIKVLDQLEQWLKTENGFVKPEGYLQGVLTPVRVDEDAAKWQFESYGKIVESPMSIAVLRYQVRDLQPTHPPTCPMFFSPSHRAFSHSSLVHIHIHIHFHHLSLHARPPQPLRPPHLLNSTHIATFPTFLHACSSTPHEHLRLHRASKQRY
jgi:hypothetical protein